MNRVAVCELGPAAVRRLGPAAGTGVDPVLARAALAAGDDPVTVVGDRAVRTAAVWRQVFATLLGDAQQAHLIHPSWWPATRPALVAELARGVVRRVVTSSRAALVGPGSVHVEIAPQLVLVSAGGKPIQGESRSAAPGDVATRVTALVAGQPPRPVALDAPAEVPGAAALAELIAARLRADGVPVHRVDPNRWVAAPEPAPPTPTPVVARRPSGVSVGLAAVLLAGLGVGWLLRPESHTASVSSTVALVEGRITVDIPEGWLVRRVTGGPGSARLEVAAPDNPAAVVHLTQAPVPGQDLRAVAATLRAVLAEQPPGVFLEFESARARAGRDAVTYREVRADAEIDWTVFVEDGIRIGVGCQSPPGDTHHAQPACELAIRSAHRIR